MHFTKEVQQNEQQEKKEFELIKEGKYECVLSSEWKKTKAGDPYIGLAFQIRDDVDQEFKKRLVFDAIYKSKTTGEYQDNKINALLAAIENSPTDFDTYDDIIQFLNGQKIKVSVVIRKADPTIPNSKDKNEIKFLSYERTSYGEWSDVPAAYRPDAKTQDADEDLPW